MIFSQSCCKLAFASFLFFLLSLNSESVGQNNRTGIGIETNHDRVHQPHYSPPVHIAPGSPVGSFAQQVGSYPFTPKAGLQIVQAPGRNEAKPGLQDRIEQAISRRQIGMQNQANQREVATLRNTRSLKTEVESSPRGRGDNQGSTIRGRIVESVGPMDRIDDGEFAQIKLASAQYPIEGSPQEEELDLPSYDGRRGIETTSSQQSERPQTLNGHDDRFQPRSVLEERPDQSFQEFHWEEGGDRFRPTQRPSYRPANQGGIQRPANFSQNNVQELEFPPVNRRQDDEFEEIDAGSGSLLDKPCEEFRRQLLGRPIQEIAMQLSPPSLARDRTRTDTLSRDWRDRYGNLIANGTMVDLQRGYLLLDSGQRIAYARLGEGELLAIADYWNIPRSCALEEQGSIFRDWVPQTYTWTASSLCHKPLYFENRQLERYGHTHGPIMQPVRSVAHFFVSLVTLPYQTGIHPPNECVYPLGLYRPGDCAPWLKDPIPISLSGISRQAMITTGFSGIPR